MIGSLHKLAEANLLLQGIMLREYGKEILPWH